MIEKTYLGDGVYASHDGWNIWLTTETTEGTQRIALDPTVLRALNAYDQRERARSVSQEATHDVD